MPDPSAKPRPLLDQGEPTPLFHFEEDLEEFLTIRNDLLDLITRCAAKSSRFNTHRARHVYLLDLLTILRATMEDIPTEPHQLES